MSGETERYTTGMSNTTTVRPLNGSYGNCVVGYRNAGHTETI